MELYAGLDPHSRNTYIGIMDNAFAAHLMMTAIYSWSKQDEDARAEAAEVLRINPKFSLERFEKRAGK